VESRFWKKALKYYFGRDKRLAVYRTRKDSGGTEYDQSTLPACVKMS
jgi:hypothetical protein